MLSQLRDMLGKLELEQRQEQEDLHGAERLQIRRVEQEIARAREQQGKLYDLLEQGLYTQEIFLERQRTLSDRMEDLRRELLALRESIPAPRDRTGLIRDLHELLEHWQELDVPEKNALLCRCVRDMRYFRPRSDRWSQEPFTEEIELDL